MARLSDVNIKAINLKKRLAVSDELGYGQMVTFIDKDGEETEDVSIAVVAVIEWFEGGFSEAVIDEFTESWQ